MDEQIVFSNHARQQLKLRSIPLASVRTAIVDPDHTEEQRENR